MPTFSLPHLTALSLPPPELIRVAARTGYDAVGLRLIAVTADTPGYALMNDPAMLRATRSALADTGLRVADIEFVKITPEIDIAALEPVVAVGAELGAKHIIAAPYDPELARLTERLACFAGLAARYGLGVVLEFFPWTVVPDFRSAAKIVGDADRPNLGVLVDTLHFARSSSRVADIATVPPSWLPFVHVCDAPDEIPADVEAMLYTARAERLPPGEGGIDILGIVRALPPDIPIALEVPMDRLTAQIGPEAVARRVREAAERLLMR